MLQPYQILPAEMRSDSRKQAIIHNVLRNVMNTETNRSISYNAQGKNEKRYTYVLGSKAKQLENKKIYSITSMCFRRVEFKQYNKTYQINNCSL